MNREHRSQGREPAGREPAGGRQPVVRDLDGLTEAVSDVARLLPTGPDELTGPEDPPAPEGRGARLSRRLHTDQDTVERDLVRLVLTIVELLRQLMERQAVHRVDQGDLTEDQEERIGMTLMLLHERMTELCERYDLTMEDLNLDLGPLGPLLPPQ